MGKAYAKVLRRLGRCLLALILTPIMSAEIFDLRSISSSREVVVNQRGSFPSRPQQGGSHAITDTKDLDAILDNNRETVARNTNGGRRCLLARRGSARVRWMNRALLNAMSPWANTRTMRLLLPFRPVGDL